MLIVICELIQVHFILEIFNFREEQSSENRLSELSAVVNISCKLFVALIYVILLY